MTWLRLGEWVFPVAQVREGQLPRVQMARGPERVPSVSALPRL